MKTYVSNTLLLFMLGSFAGCSTYYPVPVDEKNIEEQLADKQQQGLPVATSREEALDNMKKYSDWYTLKSEELRLTQQRLSDGSLGMTIVGLAAGFAGKPKGAAESVLVGTALDIPRSRYQIEVQAANYQKASDAMGCMYDYLFPLSTGEEYNRDSIPDVIFLNEKISKVRKTLRALQTNVTLAEPDIQKIQDALKTILRQPQSNSAPASAIMGEDSMRTTLPIEEVKAELDKCVALFSE